MCGFAGVFSTAGSLSPAETTLRQMQESLDLRGPDGSGMYQRGPLALVQTRLAIRDPEAGSLPLVAEEGSHVLVYNGELYNELELRRELQAAGHRFRTHCDTETVLAAWREWGTGCAARLDGMFALAACDTRTGTLMLLRDRFGLKPLYYAMAGDTLVFGSTVAAVRAWPGTGTEPDWATLSHYLTTFRLTLGSRTLLHGIRQLEPAGMLVLRNSGAAGGPRQTLSRYWDYPAGEDPGMSRPEAEELLHTELDAAVARRLVSDRPVGLLLSGGIDSGTIAALVRRQTADIHISCSGAGEPDAGGELAAARQCGTALGLSCGEVRLTADEYLATWQQLVESGELPLSTPSDVILHHLARALKPDVDVALGGEGADELLCGYGVQHRSPADYAALCDAAAGSTTLAPEFAASYAGVTAGDPVGFYFALNSLIPAAAKPLLLREDVWQAAEQDAQLRQWYARWFPSAAGEDYAAQHDRLLHRVNLEGLLARLDSTTMAAGLEVRAPFTDVRLVEAMFRVPRQYLMEIGGAAASSGMPAATLHQRGELQPKALLRSVASRLLPENLARRPKASFPTPVQSWLAGDWARRVRTRLLSSPFVRTVFQPRAIDELTGAPEQAGMWLWPLFNLSLWGDSLWWPRRDWLPAPHISAPVPAREGSSHV